MTQPNVFALDQDVVDAGAELTRARLEQPANPERIDAARQALKDAMAARWPDA